MQDGLLARLIREVPPYRRAKAAGYVFDRDRALSIGVELLLFNALSDLGITEYEVIEGVNGKPFLKGCDVCFNLSHSGNRVMCSVAPEDVGCDVEEVKPTDIDIARMNFTDEEYSIIAVAPAGLKYDSFYRFWTLKESFLKALGAGLGLELDRFNIRLDDPIGVDQDADLRRFHFKEYHPDPVFRYAVCSTCNKFCEKMISVDMHKIAIKYLEGSSERSNSYR